MTMSSMRIKDTRVSMMDVATLRNYVKAGGKKGHKARMELNKRNVPLVEPVVEEPAEETATA